MAPPPPRFRQELTHEDLPWNPPIPAASLIELLREFAGEPVVLRGWVYRLRVLGKTTFLIPRDCSGQVRCVASSEALKDLRLKSEDTVEIRGRVRLDQRASDGFEVDIVEARILNRAGNTLPFTAASDIESFNLESLIVSGQAGALAAQKIEDSSSIHATVPLREAMTPRERGTPSPLDFYLSWMSRFLSLFCDDYAPSGQLYQMKRGPPVFDLGQCFRSRTRGRSGVRVVDGA
jgi:hypothetical protein